MPTIAATTIKLNATLNTFFTKHDVGITAIYPVAIMLNAIRYHTIEQFLDFEDNKNLANEFKFHDDASSSNQAIPRFVCDIAVLV